MNANAEQKKPEGEQNEAHEEALRHPKPAQHNDDERSKMPERHDEGRKQSPADRPGKQSGEGETPVG
ncbi:hypothetical protein B0G62_109112 [Paraburkholderia eburnea]|uniref:Uncharacterized protein n=1 Tax=Paraburkholderia eburnea TaxID=1189126 RepID=A0A2S4M675_9BURK|nr:hypothetical protein [Paraburkholderia eburnea]POR50204.1 hypothetical protein B0G62_109112 [Paraburkholderia eburnea]PRZ20515.1 hypothetical protein BX588_11190 [Paraburkholderia eburnea]